MTWDVGPRTGPPVRPHSAASFHGARTQRPPTVPPAVPPLPSHCRPLDQNMYRPPSAAPLFAPRPQQSVQDLRLETQRVLDEPFGVSVNGATRYVSPSPSFPSYPQRQKIQGQMSDHVPRFIPPGNDISYRGPSPRSALSPPPLLPPQAPLLANGSWYWQAPADVGSVTSLMASSSLADRPPARPAQDIYGVTGPVRSPHPPAATLLSEKPRLAAPLPSITVLQNARPLLQSPSATDSNRVAWIRDVLLLIRRASVAEETNYLSHSAAPLISDVIPSGPIKVLDPALLSLAESAVALLISIMPTLPARKEELSPALAEALFIRATLTASGAFPEFIPASPRNAFREFERSARAGFPHAWFRLGRDYEGVGDIAHARQCFEKGESEGDVGCIYRIGMAHLLGQLDFRSDSDDSVEQAAQLLHRAATSATIDFPHPPYVFALLLLGQFEKISIPSQVLARFIPAGSNAMAEARLHLERAAFLHFVPAQQHIGHAYEFADPPFPFDPLLSKEYYSLASAGGDPQADLALSKWFLCGAEGYFGKDEELARHHAARAAERGLPAAMFAMGYYYEVGIGGLPSDVGRARYWYEKAAAHGETEAVGRLSALSDSAAPLSREQHDTLAETRLVRSRTRARMRSDAETNGTSPDVGPDTFQSQGMCQGRLVSRPPGMLTVDYHAPSAPLMQPHRVPQHSLSLPPPRTSGRVAYGSYGPPENQSPEQQQFTNRPRYSLVDPGVAHPAGNIDLPPPYARRSASAGAPLPHMRRRNNSPPGMPYASPQASPRMMEGQLPADVTPATNPVRASGTRYNTFEEMGIKGGRAEDKDCVIM